MIGKRTVVCLGLSQLICWGVSYYLIGIFGDLMAADLGWSQPLIYGGFSAALVAMGLSSPFIGGLIDRHGGRSVMTAGSLLTGVSIAGIALSHAVLSYYAAWLCLGIAMRLTLYEAAFATLARIGGPAARRPIAQVTLFGGLASSVFWPLGQALAQFAGWRGATLIYAGLALATVPLHLALSSDRHPRVVTEAAAVIAPAVERKQAPLLAAGLYMTIATLATFLNSGMSAHMIPILAGLGIAASASVWIATLRGIGQSLARLSEVIFGAQLHPLRLNLVASLILPVSFAVGLLSARSLAAAAAFAFLYGAGNGIATITRGTMPLVLFNVHTYGAVTGRLLMPSFFLAALAPAGYAFVVERFGENGALVFSLLLAVLLLAASLCLVAWFRDRSTR